MKNIHFSKIPEEKYVENISFEMIDPSILLLIVEKVIYQWFQSELDPGISFQKRHVKRHAMDRSAQIATSGRVLYSVTFKQEPNSMKNVHITKSVDVPRNT
jgi:hypothetical protein